MTEAEWLSCTEPVAMREHVRCSRKRRLRAAACVRRAWWCLSKQGRAAVETAERFADGDATEANMVALLLKPTGAFTKPFTYRRDRPDDDPESRDFLLSCEVERAMGALLDLPHDRCHVCGAEMQVVLMAKGAARECPSCPGAIRWDLSRATHFLRRGAFNNDERLPTGADLADDVRELVGNPFRPVAFDPAWRTDTAVALARQMYDARDFGAIPILADALQDAGCEDEQVLTHCREPRAHVRGCWVCDAVLALG